MNELWCGKSTSISLHSYSRCCQSLGHVLQYVRSCDLFLSSEEQQFRRREICLSFSNCQVVAFFLLSRTEPSRSAICASFSFPRAKVQKLADRMQRAKEEILLALALHHQGHLVACCWSDRTNSDVQIPLEKPWSQHLWTVMKCGIFNTIASATRYVVIQSRNYPDKQNNFVKKCEMQFYKAIPQIL